jgi:hypothetical protein
MYLYTLKCDHARQRQAIGAFHSITAVFTAESEAAAVRLYRDLYETAGPPIVLVERGVYRGEQRAPIVDGRRDATGRWFQVNDRVVSDTVHPGREGRIVKICPGLPLVEVVSDLPFGELRDRWPESDIQLVRARTSDEVPCW